MNTIINERRNDTFDKESACKTIVIARIEMTKQSRDCHGLTASQ